MAKWRPFADYTPLAQLIVHYMWEQRPPLLPAQFADAVGISRQTVSRILNQDTAPEPFVLLRMARLIGVSSQQMFLAAGYTTVDTPIYTHDEAWEMVIAALRTQEGMTDDARATAVMLLVQTLEHHRSQALSPLLPTNQDALDIPTEQTPEA